MKPEEKISPTCLKKARGGASSLERALLGGPEAGQKRPPLRDAIRDQAVPMGDEEASQCQYPVDPPPWSHSINHTHMGHTIFIGKQKDNIGTLELFLVQYKVALCFSFLEYWWK